MLVQHFSPSSSTTTITNSSFSSFSPLSTSLIKNSKTSILSPFFNSESTGFQPTIEQNIRMGCTEKITTHFSAWPTKLTAVMEIHRQRFSQLNPRFKRQQETAATLLQPVEQPVLCPIILPSTLRPQPRQQGRSKQHQQTHFPPTQPTRRPNTAHIKYQQSPPAEPNRQYITLANLTKILHVLQTNVKTNGSEASIDTSTSTTNSTKQRVQQHLQDTAARWWKSIRPSDCQPSVPPPSLIPTYTTSATSTQLPSSDVLQQHQESHNVPSHVIVSNMTRQLNIPSNIVNATSKYHESASSTEIQPITVITPIIQPYKTPNTRHSRHEPLIMQTRGMRLHSYDHHRYYNNQNNINFLQQQRLIRQT